MAADEHNDETREHDDPPADSAPTSTRPDAKPPAKKKGRWRRRLKIAALATPVLMVAMWLAVHHIPGFGPLVADTLRAVVGKKAVAWLEDTVYGVEDWVNRRTRSEQKPEALWEVPASATAEAAPAGTTPSTAGSAKTDGSAEAAEAKPPFRLANVDPIYDNIATRGDGVWLPLTDPRKPNDRVRLLKTMLHPDKHRSWAVVAVIALDLSSIDLHLVAGRYEPKSKTKEAKAYKRTAVIPSDHHDALIAAFNGGYKATHGDYGMLIDDVTLVPPRPLACCVAKYKDGGYRIGSWKALRDTKDDMVWLRQTPICMYEDGKPHPALSMPKMGWGASAVSGTTVIRRSAIGIDDARKVIYVGIGDFTTAQTIARALKHAGATSIAQLDVNFSFPKFLTYKHDEGDSHKLLAVPLTGKFEFEPDQYVGTRSHRDFFYIVRRGDES
jgi:hypothetical protein